MLGLDRERAAACRKPPAARPAVSTHLHRLGGRVVAVVVRLVVLVPLVAAGWEEGMREQVGMDE